MRLFLGQNKKVFINVKLILMFLLALICGLVIGYVFGVANGWKQCVDFGINFIKFDNIVDKELIRSAILQYKSSLGGWAFDPTSPFYVG